MAGLEVEAIEEVGRARSRASASAALDRGRAAPDADRLHGLPASTSATGGVTVVSAAPGLRGRDGACRSRCRARRCPAGATVAAATLRGVASGRHAVLARASSGSATTRTACSSFPPTRAGHARCVDAAGRRATRCSSSRSRRTAATGCRSSASRARSRRSPARALRQPRAAARASAARRRRDAVRVRIEAPDLCPRYAARVVRGVRVGPSPLLAAAPPAARRHAPDQQRRRRHQLRDARARPAAARLRPRARRRRRRSSSAARARGRDARHARRRRARARGRRSGDRRRRAGRSRSPASWAAQAREVTARRRATCCSRAPSSPPSVGAPHRAGGSGSRRRRRTASSAASIPRGVPERARRGRGAHRAARRRRASRRASSRRRRASATLAPRPVRAAARRVRGAPRRVAARAARSRRRLRALGATLPARRRAAAGHAAVVPRRPRDRGGPRRGGRAPRRLRRHARHAAADRADGRRARARTARGSCGASGGCWSAEGLDRDGDARAHRPGDEPAARRRVRRSGAAPVALANPLSSETERAAPLAARRACCARCALNLEPGRGVRRRLRDRHGLRTSTPQGAVRERRAIAGPAARRLAAARASERSGPPVDFADLKGVVQNLLAGLGHRRTTRRAGGRRRDVAVPAPRQGGARRGRRTVRRRRSARSIPRSSQALDLAGEVWLFELDFQEVAHYGPRRVASRPLPRFPAVTRDIAVVVDDAFLAETILEEVRALGDPLIESVRAVRLLPRRADRRRARRASRTPIAYRAPDRTLTDDEVNAAARARARAPDAPASRSTLRS